MKRDRASAYMMQSYTQGHLAFSTACGREQGSWPQSQRGARAYCPLPPSNPWGLRLGVTESAEGQAPGPGRVPKRRVKWKAGVLESRDVARAPGRGVTSSLAGGALSCGPRDGCAVLLGFHAQCSNARGLAVWLSIHLVAIEARTEASCSKQAAHVCLAHMAASPRDTQEVGDAAGPRARRMSMRGHTGRHWVTRDHTGWHRRGGPIVANPGRVLDLETVKGEMSQTSWENSSTAGALSLSNCPSLQRSHSWVSNTKDVRAHWK